MSSPVKHFEVAARPPLFYMHIPKTAGVSVRQYLLSQYAMCDVYPAGSWLEMSRTTYKAQDYLLIAGHFQYNMRHELLPETQHMTVLRNPLVRTVSALRHLQRDVLFHRDHAIAKTLTIKDMLRTPKLIQQQANVQAASLCASVPPANVLDFLRLEENANADPVYLEAPPTLEHAVKALDSVHFLGTTDDLASLAILLSEKLGFHPTTMPMTNCSPEGMTGLGELDGEDLKILEYYNEIDLKVYAAAKEIIAQRAFERAMHKLLERGIYKRMRGSFDFDLGEPVPGSGWHEPEDGGNGGVWRWTGPGPKFSLELPLQPDAAYEVELRFMSTRFVGGFSAAVNGYPLTTCLASEGKHHTLTLKLENNVLRKASGCCRLVFDPGFEAGPIETDSRNMGVAVNRIAFERIA